MLRKCPLAGYWYPLGKMRMEGGLWKRENWSFVFLLKPQASSRVQNRRESMGSLGDPQPTQIRSASRPTDGISRGSTWNLHPASTLCQVFKVRALSKTQAVSLTFYFFFLSNFALSSTCIWNQGKHKPHVFNPRTLKSSNCCRPVLWRPAAMPDCFKDVLPSL